MLNGSLRKLFSYVFAFFIMITIITMTEPMAATIVIMRSISSGPGGVPVSVVFVSVVSEVV